MKSNKLFILVLMILCFVKLDIVCAENIYKEYKVGDKITYNGMDFYVIENSDSTSDRVTMLKAEPLTVDEVNTYGVGHVNRYATYSVGTAYDENGYGGMQYYTSETCGYVNGSIVNTLCINDYESSEVKYVVDAWANEMIKSSDLKEDNLGYKIRLLTIEDLATNLGYVRNVQVSDVSYEIAENTPLWVYNGNYGYWTMSKYEDSNSSLWLVSMGSNVRGCNASDGCGNTPVVRPVVTLKKITENSSENIETEKEEDNIKNEVIENNKKPNQIISVPDTFLNRTVIGLIVGIILIIIGIVIIYAIKNKKEFKLFLKKKDKK